jgi:protein-arginine kinase activator protein McsA
MRKIGGSMRKLVYVCDECAAKSQPVDRGNSPEKWRHLEVMDLILDLCPKCWMRFAHHFPKLAARANGA